MLDAVRQGMRQKAPRAPGPHDRVHKEECMFSFDTAFSPQGLCINLHTWQAFGAGYVALDASRSGNSLYLRQRATKARPPGCGRPARCLLACASAAGAACQASWVRL